MHIYMDGEICCKQTLLSPLLEFTNTSKGLEPWEAWARHLPSESRLVILVGGSTDTLLGPVSQRCLKYSRHAECTCTIYGFICNIIYYIYTSRTRPGVARF